MLDHSNDGFSFAAAPSRAILWRWRFPSAGTWTPTNARTWDTADKVTSASSRSISAYLARVLLRLSHVPPESAPNPVTVEGK